MCAKRKVEVFTAGCPVCHEAIKLVNRLACRSCEVEVLDMNQAEVVNRARKYGVRRVPAIVIDGHLADCCASGEPDAAVLQDAGLGQSAT